MNEGNVRKWRWLFEEVGLMRVMRKAVGACTVQGGSFANTIFTVPIMHQILTFVSPPQETCGWRESEE